MLGVYDYKDHNVLSVARPTLTHSIRLTSTAHLLAWKHGANKLRLVPVFCFVYFSHGIYIDDNQWRWCEVLVRINCSGRLPWHRGVNGYSGKWCVKFNSLLVGVRSDVKRTKNLDGKWNPICVYTWPPLRWSWEAWMVFAVSQCRFYAWDSTWTHWGGWWIIERYCYFYLTTDLDGSDVI